MSVWIDAKEKLPPLNEEVLILYKNKTDDITEENLYYGLGSRAIDADFDFERWTYSTEHSKYHEVVF